MPNGCSCKISLKFCLIQFHDKNLKKFKIRTLLNFPIRFYTTAYWLLPLLVHGYFRSSTWQPLNISKPDHKHLNDFRKLHVLQYGRSTSKSESEEVCYGISGAPPVQPPAQGRSHYSRQDYVQLGSACLQGWRTYSISERLVSLLQ